MGPDHVGLGKRPVRPRPRAGGPGAHRQGPPRSSPGNSCAEATGDDTIRKFLGENYLRVFERGLGAVGGVERTNFMATLKGVIRDSVSGASVEAKVHVLTSSGHFVHPGRQYPEDRSGGPRSSTVRGEFAVDVPRGSTDIVVERGTEYETPSEGRFHARQRGRRGRAASQAMGRSGVGGVVSGEYAPALQ